MIKTLRITSIIAAILAVGLFVFPVVFGFRSDEEIERFLKSPGAIEKFRQAKGSGTRGNGDQISPLVKQAEGFALYLNPPTKPKEPERQGQPPVEKVPEIPRGPVTAKFTLVATSVNEARPEESLALINEPGKGLNWVRQSNVVGHLTFERIEDGRVILKGGKGTSVLSVEARPPRRSLLADSSSASIVSESPISFGSRKAGSGAADGRITSIEPTMTSEEERALAEKIFAELEAMAKEAESGATDSESGDKEGTAATGKIIPSTPEATRISGEEAKNLGDLGQELKDVRRDPSRAKVSKGLRDRKSWRDRRNQMIKEREKARAKALAERNKPVEE